MRKNSRVVAAVLLGLIGPVCAHAAEDQSPVGWIQGEVRSLDGKPLKGIKVSAEREGKKTEQSFFGPAESDPEGKFRLEAIPVGTYRVQALGAFGIAAKENVAVETGKPATGLVLEPPMTAQERLGSDEGFKKVTAFVSEMKKKVEDTEALKRLSSSPKRELPPGARLEGTVLDSAGKPVPGVIVVLSDSGGNPMVDFVTEADPQGRFLLENVPDGSYSLQAGTGPDRKTEKQPLQVKKGRPDSSFRLTLP